MHETIHPITLFRRVLHFFEFHRMHFSNERMVTKRVAFGECPPVTNQWRVFFMRERSVAQVRVVSPLVARVYVRRRTPLSTRMLTQQRGLGNSFRQTLELSIAESGAG